ncbi:hypothetical protein GCM10022293_12770 [Azospirillum formosense]
MGALARVGDRFDFVQVRHEELAAFMATAHAKYTDELGVCLATSGPGAIHLLNGLYDAKLDHQPVLAIVGQQALTALGGHYQQEVDLISLFKDVAGEFVHMASTPAQVRHLVDRAVRIAKAALPDDLPFVTGSIGLLGTRPSYEMMTECDTLLMVGSGFPYSEFLPKEGQARGVQIDIDPKMLSIRYPMEVNLVGDSASTLRALIPLLQRKQDRSWRQTIEAGVAEWWRVLEARAMNDATPLNPQRVFWELSPKLPDDVVIACDTGSGTNWYARDLKIRRGMKATLCGGLATMGPGMPYAIAAKFAHPDRPVLAIVGDGAMQMNGMNGLITVSKYWKQWADPRFVVLVLNNRDLNQVTWEMRAQAGDPKFEASQQLPDADAFTMEWAMVWKEILFGFTIAGFISVFVPQSVWDFLFVGNAQHPSFWAVAENAAVAPVVAFFTFIGSMGNVPLAAMLWSKQVSLGGVMAFLGADLVAATVVWIHAKYYGWRYAGYLSLVMYVCMVAAGITVHYLYALTGLTPTARPSLTDMVRFAIDHTFFLNLAFGALAGWLLWTHFSGGHGERQHDGGGTRAGSAAHGRT